MILLALFNDVTMIPVAEDNQSAAAEPQHAMIGHLIGFSMTLGIFQSVSALTMVFTIVCHHAIVRLSESAQFRIWNEGCNSNALPSVLPVFMIHRWNFTTR